MPKDLNLTTFVISLIHAKDRQDLMRQHLSEHGLDFEFIEAIDGMQFDVPNHPAHHTLLRRLFFGRDLKGAELGCLLSHKKCYEKIIKENIPLSLIFEDDIALQDSFSSLLSESLKHINQFDILRFIIKPKLLKKPHKKIADLDQTHFIGKTHGVPGGAYAYLITLEGAQKMLSKMDRNHLPVDTLMGQSWKTGLKSYVVMPGIVDYRRDLGSFIGEERFDKSELDLKMPLKLIYPLTRFGYKLYENLMRWVRYLI